MVGSIGLGRGQLVNSVSVEVSVEVEGGVPLQGGEQKKNEAAWTRTHAYQIYIPP